MSDDHDPLPRSGHPQQRHSLGLLIIPVAVYIRTPVVAYSVEPWVLGLPFITTYTNIVTILTWFFVSMAARSDRFHRRNVPKHVPADIAFG